MDDRPNASVYSLCLKLATVGDKITLSVRMFHTFTTRLEKKWPSLADRVWKLHGIPWSTANCEASEKFTRVKVDMIVQNFILLLLLLLRRCSSNMCVRTTGWPKKIWHHFFLYALTLLNINRISKFFTLRIRREFVIMLLLKIPPHLKCVVTLPCEMSVS